MAVQWPNGARCVVVLTVDWDGHANEIGRGWAPVGARSVGGYSGRCGIPRMLDIFARHGVPATFFAPGYDVEHEPEVARKIVAAGHELGAHGYVHESFDVSLEEEERLLRKTHDIIAETLGSPPVGWRNPGGKKSDRTLAVLEELSYIYDCSDKDYDLPYAAIVNGERSRSMIELPSDTAIVDDAPVYRAAAYSAVEMLDVWKAAFAATYNDTGYYLQTCHPRAGAGSGIPSRARTVDRLIDYIKTYPDVHFSTMADLARWCLDPSHGFIDTPEWIGGRA